MPRTSERFSGRTVRYSPRNGTIRGSASPSTQRETRSACSPAQTTSRSTRRASPLDTTRTPPGTRRIVVTAADTRTSPPPARSSLAIVSATAA